MKQTRNLEDLLRQYDLLAAPAARDAAVTGICNDSRRAQDGDLFICKGYGFKPEYLAMARRQGAVCALAETDFPGVDIPCIRVTDVRKAQSLAARWFYDNPSDGLTLIGVTGTKGKTTTSYMIQAVTNALAGRTMGLSSSAGRYCGGPDVDTHLTTPESLDLQWLFAQARDHGLPYMTAEVSSQAYQVERVYGEHFDIGVFLNFSEDHISPKEHASMEEYLQCKLQLLENSGRAVICRETAQFDRVYDTARRCCRETLLVGMDRDDCDLTVRQVEKLTHGFRFSFRSGTVRPCTPITWPWTGISTSKTPWPPSAWGVCWEQDMSRWPRPGRSGGPRPHEPVRGRRRPRAGGLHAQPGQLPGPADGPEAGLSRRAHHRGHRHRRRPLPPADPGHGRDVRQIRRPDLLHHR